MIQITGLSNTTQNKKMEIEIGDQIIDAETIIITVFDKQEEITRYVYHADHWCEV